MKIIYVDNNATTQVAPEVFEEMMPYLTEFYGNPSSMHTFGGQVGDKIKEARGKVADLIGASPEEIVLTSCGTESDSTGYSRSLACPTRTKIISSPPGWNIRLLKIFVRTWPNGYRVTYCL